MVDVSEKAVTLREAVARGRIRISPRAMRLVRSGRLKKGAVTEVARLAGIVAAKRTSEAIPLCHPLSLTFVDVELEPRSDGFSIEARVRTEAKTGAEMEALHAVAVAALTVYDMVKSADRGMTLTDIRVVEKSGGKSGPYSREEEGEKAESSRRGLGTTRGPRASTAAAARRPRDPRF